MTSSKRFLSSIPPFAVRACSGTVSFVLGSLALSCSVAVAREANKSLGFYFRTEGAAALDITSGIGENYVAYRPAEFPWGDALSASSGAFAGRGELGFEFEGTDGVLFRAGIIFSGWSASQNPSDFVYGMVNGEMGPNPGDRPEYEIRISDVDQGREPLPYIDRSLTRDYWEIMPEFLIGSVRTDESVRWLGIQPFYGEFSQFSSLHTLRLPGDSPLFEPRGVDTSLRARTYGALLTLQKEKWLKEDLKCFTSFGLGAYGLDAESQSVALRNGGEQNDTRSIVGFRGQLGVGSDWYINPKLSLGLVGRIDLWSGSPNVPGPGAYGLTGFRRPNGDLVVSPPKIIGDWSITSDTRVDLFAGIRMTYLLSSKKP